MLSHVWLFMTPWTVACQIPLSMGFPRQEHWSGLPFPSPGDLPNPGIEPGSPVLQADSLPSEPLGKPKKSRDNQNNKQVWSWSTKWRWAKANRILLREHAGIGNTLYQKHKKWLYTWTLPNGQYWNQIDYILCSQRWRSSIQSAKTRPGADCGSYHELLITKFRLKLKKVGKTTRPFRYNLNQITYDYRVEMINRFKGLDLVDRMSEELWTEMCNILQEAVTKTTPKKNVRRQRGGLRRLYK